MERNATVIALQSSLSCCSIEHGTAHGTVLQIAHPSRITDETSSPSFIVLSLPKQFSFSDCIAVSHVSLYLGGPGGWGNTIGEAGVVLFCAS